MTETFRSADGRKVVEVGSAEDVGKVSGFSVDLAATRVESIGLAGRRHHGELVPWTSVESFGPDAVMVMVKGVEQASEDFEPRTLRGRRVLSTAGFELGTVDDVMFDAGTGAIVSVSTATETIAADRLQSVGSYALVVKAG